MAKLANTGLVRAAKLLGAVDSVAPFSKLKVGTGTTAESSAHTALITEVADVTVTPTYEATNKCVWSGTITGFTVSHTLWEVGVFASDDCMFLRHLWSVGRSVDVGDSVQVTVKTQTGESV